MLASISPLGERARGNRWGTTATAFTAGSVAAAAALGAALGSASGWTPTGARLLALASAAVAAGLLDFLAPARLPGLRRQVDEDWLARFRGWVYGVGYGCQLGLGVVTIVSTGFVYAWIVALGGSGSAGGGAVVGAAFGAARAAPLWLVRGCESPQALRQRIARLDAGARAGRFAASGAGLAIGAAALAGALAGRA